MKNNLRKNLLVYGVTDRHWLNGRSLAGCVEESIKGGVSFIQLREKNLDREVVRKEAFEIKEICSSFNVPFVIDDDVILAKEVGADGVHVGQKDMECIEARKILGNDKIIGVTAASVEKALAAEKNGADYIGCGAAFPTGSKSDAVVISHDVYRSICSAVKIPVVAIGGITASNVEQLKGSGICGVAVISAIYGAPDIKAAASELKEKCIRFFL